MAELTINDSIDTDKQNWLQPSRIHAELSTIELESLFRSLHSLLLASAAQTALEVRDEWIEPTERMHQVLQSFGLNKVTESDGQDQNRWVATNANSTVQLVIGFLRDWWTNETIPIWRSICKSTFSEDQVTGTTTSSAIVEVYQSLHRTTHLDGRNIVIQLNNNLESISKSLIELGFYRLQRSSSLF